MHNIEYTLRIIGDDVSAGDYMTWVRQDVANANPGAECAAAFASLHTEMDCSACDAGASCGLCLMALAAGECPANPDLGSCELVAVDGELCEGDGECDTDNQHNNCGGYEVYKKVPCEESPVAEDATPVVVLVGGDRYMDERASSNGVSNDVWCAA